MSETWTPITGYDTGDYTDTMVFEVDYDTKKLEKMSGQTLVAGEENSQYIRFTMPRYWDGIDITDKTIQVVYMLTNQYFGYSDVINVEYTEDAVQFGWVVPKTACCISAALLFEITVTDTDYVLKSQITEVPVVQSLDPEGTIPEPSQEEWYIEFQERVNAAISQAEGAVSSAAASAEHAAESAEAAENAKNSVDGTKSALDAVLAVLQETLDQVGVNKIDIATLVGRLNAMVADYDASAETEILDARVGHNGITYTSMGAAIRGQFDELRLYVDADGYVCQSSGA